MEEQNVPNNEFDHSEGAQILKSRSTAGLLGVFIGCFGAHNFYLGYTKKAIIQLVITLVGFVLCCIIIGLIPLLAVGIWSAVESINILTGKVNEDAQGRPLAD